MSNARYVVMFSGTARRSGGIVTQDGVPIVTQDGERIILQSIVAGFLASAWESLSGLLTGFSFFRWVPAPIAVALLLAFPAQASGQTTVWGLPDSGAVSGTFRLLCDIADTSGSTRHCTVTRLLTFFDANGAFLPIAGGTLTGDLLFEGATADGFELTITVVDPTADRTVTFLNETFTVEDDNHVAEHAENAADELLIENAGTACANNEAAASDGSGGLDCTALAAAAWTQADPVVQVTVANDVHVGDGAGTLAGKLEIGGDADQPQLVIEGFSTQTDDILIIQNDADTEVFSVSNAGTLPLTTVNELASSTSANLATVISDETGSGVAVFGTTPTIATPSLTGKLTANAVSVSDDDCTGEQGDFWYDDTDSAFEFCNANSGTPAVLGGGGTDSVIYTSGGSSSVGQTSGTRYLGNQQNSGSCTSGPNSGNYKIPVAMTMTSISVEATTTPVSGQTYVYTVMEDCVATAITCTIAAAATACTDTGTEAIAADSNIQMRIVIAGGGAPASPGNTDFAGIMTID